MNDPLVASKPDDNRRLVLSNVLALLSANGLTIDDLVGYASGTGPAAQVPTVAQHLPRVIAATGDGARRTYERYWRLAAEMIGDRPLDAVTVEDLTAVAATARARAVVRRNGTGGVGAEENCIAALRCLFRLAVQDGLIQVNPALQLAKPRREPVKRRPLSPGELAAVWKVVESGGNDPLLDCLLLRFFWETDARRGNALALRLSDLDGQRVRLHGGDDEQWQPISETLAQALLCHAKDRGAVSQDDQVFRYLPRRGETVGRPMTRRRFDALTERINEALPWAAGLGVLAN